MGIDRIRLVTSCAAGIEYAGHFYVQWADRLPAVRVRGDTLGEAVYPPCNTPGDCDEGEYRGEPTKVWQLRGVDPEVAVVGREEGTGKLAVFGRLRAEPSDYFRLTKKGVWRLRDQ